MNTGYAYANLKGVLVFQPASVSMVINGIFDNVSAAYDTGKPVFVYNMWNKNGIRMYKISPSPCYVRKTFTRTGLPVFRLYFGDWIITIGYYTDEHTPIAKKDNYKVQKRFE